VVARGGIDPALRMFNPSTILEYRGSDVRPARYPHGFGFLCIEAKTEIYSSAKRERCYDPLHKADYRHDETQRHQRPVTGLLRVVRIEGGLVMGGCGLVRVLGRDFLNILSSWALCF
jgi:hypothetical protein